MSMLCIAIVGMNAAGKSNFGKKLASKLGWKRSDTDILFRARHGEEAAYIELHGLAAFRQAEEAIVLKALEPGYVVILGGGAIESARVREALKERTIVLWLQISPERMHRHLQEARRERPDLPAEKRDIEVVLAKRNALYRDVAKVTLFDHIPYQRRVAVALKLLRSVFTDLRQPRSHRFPR